jgi:cell wall-associated NlpC family hydrolase
VRGPKIAHGLARVANQQIHAAEQPILHQLAQERAANLAKAQAQMGFAKAAAALMQQAAPNVQSGYANAADATAGYAKGLGDMVQAPLAQNQQAQNAFLTNMGTPQGALQAAPPVGGLAYGTQGLIPATSLQREGAAFGAAAQLAPGNMLHQGQQAAAGILGNDPNIQSLQAELAKIAATRPDVYRQLVAQMQASRQAQQRIGISEQNVQLRAQALQETHQYHQLSVQMAQERIGLARRKDAQAVWSAIQKGHRPDASLSKVYGYVVDYNGDPILNKQGRRIPVKKSGGSSGGLPTLPGVKPNPNGAGSFGAGIVPSAYITSPAGRKIVDLAREYLGIPYEWGGESPKGFDCSGIAQYVYGKVGIQIPRTTYTQWTAPNGHAVGKRNLRPGDLVFYKGSDSIVQNGKVLPGHVGIYIGHGKIINAYGTGYGVRIDSVFSPAMGGYMGARRYR